MSTLDTTSSFLSYGDSHPTGGETSAATSETLAITEHDERELFRKAWDNVLNDKLIEWGRNPELLEEDELIPPSRAAVESVRKLALRARDGGFAPPMRVVPDGDGGIVFERWTASGSESFEVSDSGEIEYVSCISGHVISRKV